jgi:hypothetical protein
MASRSFETWNKKIHIYMGLYLLVFLWLFALSGLFMNHSDWFHHEAARPSFEKQVVLPQGVSDLEKARSVLEQIGQGGEILLTTTEPKPNHFSFRAIKPQRYVFVGVDLATSRCTYRFTEPVWSGFAPWAHVMEDIHAWTGIRSMYNEPGGVRDWWVTRVWSFSLDALSLAVAFLVCSGWYMWWRRPQRRIWGGAALGVGVLASALFLWGFDLIR